MAQLAMASSAAQPSKEPEAACEVCVAVRYRAVAAGDQPPSGLFLVRHWEHGGWRLGLSHRFRATFRGLPIRHVAALGGGSTGRGADGA